MQLGGKFVNSPWRKKRATLIELLGRSGMRNTNALHVFIGTKAQYIKTAPLLRLMQQKNIDYNLIDSGQHAEFATGLRKELLVKEPDVRLEQKGGNIKSVKEIISWFFRYLYLAIFRPDHIRNTIFREKRGICVIHGDTPSTFIAMLLAKRAGIRIAHIEAGLRSYRFLKPFPEEIIRVLCMKFSDYLFAPSDWAYDNIVRMKAGGKIFNIGQNTNVEALHFSLDRSNNPPGRAYCVMTVHRVETILSRERLSFAVRAASRAADVLPMLFIMHDPTYKKLTEFGLLEQITQNPRITASGLKTHSDFLNLIANADFVITDGGSIQEESFYLDVPCLLMRTETERPEGLNGNVRLCGFSTDIFEGFLKDYRKLKKGERVKSIRPSESILAVLLNHLHLPSA